MLVFSFVLKTFKPLGMIQSLIIGADSSPDNVCAIQGFSATSLSFMDIVFLINSFTCIQL